MLTQQVQLQRGQTQTTSSHGHSTPTITTVQIGSDGQIQNAQEAVDNMPGNQGHVQSLGTLMVPIATHQGEGTQVVANVVPSSMMLTTQAGQIPVMYYAGPSSGIMSVSQLNDGDQTAVQNHHLQSDGSEVSHSLAGTLSLSNVHVQHDMTSNYHGQNVVTENSGTQTPDEVHNIVNESSMNHNGTLPKQESPNSQNQNEV
jgi:hypothetical protein